MENPKSLLDSTCSPVSYDNGHATTVIKTQIGRTTKDITFHVHTPRCSFSMAYLIIESVRLKLSQRMLQGSFVLSSEITVFKADSKMRMVMGEAMDMTKLLIILLNLKKNIQNCYELFMDFS